MKNVLSLIMLGFVAVALAGCEGMTGNNTAGNTANTANTAAKPAAAAPTKDALMALEKSAYEAWKNKDAKFWDPFLTANFVGYGAVGRMDRTAAIKQYSGTDCDVKSYTHSEDEMTPLGADAALITYKVAYDGTCGGQKLPAEVWAAGVYVRDGDKWKGAFHAETPVVDPKAPPKPAPAAKTSADAAKSDAAKSDAAAPDALMAHEQKLWDVWKQKDAKALEEMLGANYVFVQGSGRMDKAKVINAWATENKCEVGTISLTEPTTVSLTSDLYLLTYKGGAEGKCDGQPITTDWYAAINQKTGDTWKSLFGMGIAQ